jgi:hypothetical protein
MKKLRFNLEDLVSSFTFDSEGLAKEYFDTFTGEVINIPDEVMRAAEGDMEEEELADWQRELLAEAEAILEDEENRYLVIPKIKSSYVYDAMVEFAGQLPGESKLKEKLEAAFNGKHPMRDFKDELHNYPEELEQWYEYEDNKAKDYVLQWLDGHNIEVEN